MSNAQLDALRAYVELRNTNAALNCFRVAQQLGIFTVLADGQKTIPEIVDTCHLQAEPLGLLLDALCAVGVVERYDEYFALAQVMHLLPDEFRDLGQRYWDHLADFVKTGQRVPANEKIPLDEADYCVEANSSAWMMTPAALDMVKALDIGNSRKGMKVLQLGGDAGVWSLTIAHRDPQTEITLVDSPQGLARAESAAESIGMAERLRTVPGDCFQLELPESSFDLVLLVNLTHRHDRPTNEQLLARIHRWLCTDGEIGIIDLFPGQEDAALSFGMASLEVQLRTNVGRIHSPAELRQMLLESGFSAPQFAYLPAPPRLMGLLLARKSNST